MWSRSRPAVSQRVNTPCGGFRSRRCQNRTPLCHSVHEAQGRSRMRLRDGNRVAARPGFVGAMGNSFACGYGIGIPHFQPSPHYQARTRQRRWPASRNAVRSEPKASAEHECLVTVPFLPVVFQVIGLKYAACCTAEALASTVKFRIIQEPRLLCGAAAFTRYHHEAFAQSLGFAVGFALFRCGHGVGYGPVAGRRTSQVVSGRAGSHLPRD